MPTSDRPDTMGHQVVTDYTTNISTENSNVKEYVRARPCANGGPPPDEYYRPDPQDRRKITVKDPNVPGAAATAFAFDEVFWTDTSQSQIYQVCCEPMVRHCLKGFNSCLFAYGQTGSGKTYNIFGEDNNRGIYNHSHGKSEARKRYNIYASAKRR